jgi:predicted phage tail protein
MTKIIGSGGGGKGGGGGSQRVAVEEKDSLQSKAFAQVLDLLCEGEIGGLVDGLKSIYFDGTPVENTNGTLNFKGLDIKTRVGTQDQEYIPGYSATQNEVQVGVEVRREDPNIGITRTVTNESVDAVRVRISIPQFTEQDMSTGDIRGSEVTYKIQLQSNGTGYNDVSTETVIGKSTSKYERSTRVELTGEPPWDIRVIRETKNSTQSAVQNRIFWESYTEIVDGKLSYPNSALVAISIDASQFSSIPTRGYEVKLLKIKIPSNATVREDGSLEYSGTWDGEFQIAWSSNPAWVLYDILTAKRYGLGNFINEDLVDKWALYTCGKYCDELVDDGDGGLEPRFSCNLYIQSRQEAYQVIQDIASIFRGMTYWASGTITVVQDSPADAEMLFTPANVVDGLFNYSGSSAKSRHTVAIVAWNDPEDFYKQKAEYVEDQDGIARYGILEAQVTAFGCTSRGQANRVGRWLLYSEQYQTEIVNFRTGLEGGICRPGQVIKVADPVRAGARRGGRIVSATTTTVRVDQVLTIDAFNHKLSVVLPDGTVEERQILSVNGKDLEVATAFSAAPNNGSIWMISSSSIEAQVFRVVSASEADDGTYQVTALAHNPDKYDAIENGLQLEPRSISILSSIPDSPVNLKLTETLYAVDADVRVKLTVSWNSVTGASSYGGQYQREGGNIIKFAETTTNEIEILNVEPGVYTATIFAINPVGAQSLPATASKEVLGKAAPPSGVTGFSLMPVAGQAYLSWNKSLDLDVLIGGTVRIRHTPNSLDPAWKNSVDIVPALPGNATRVQAPLLSGTYMAKFVDSSGVAANDEAVIVTTVPEASAINVVETITESPAFAGAKVNMAYTDFYGALALTAATLIDDVIVNVDDIPNFDYADGVALEGTYDFASVFDLGAAYSSRLTAAMQVSAADVADSIDQRANLVDTWLDLDGDFIDDVNAELFMQTTSDDPGSMGAVWTEWKRFFVGEYTARAFKFQLRATSASENHNVLIEDLSVTIDMADRVVNLTGLTSGTGTYAVTFAEPFKEEPTVGITAYNLNSGDYYVISGKTRSGFSIQFRNSGGTGVSRTFDVLAKGYGRQQ